jgi:uncharacterized protein YegL
VIGPDGEKTDQISCFPSNVNRCIVIREPKKLGAVGGFVSPTLARATSYHDDTLIGATSRINAVIDEVMKAAKSDARSLLLLVTDGGPMLAWVEQQVIDDDGR